MCILVLGCVLNAVLGQNLNVTRNIFTGNYLSDDSREKIGTTNNNISTSSVSSLSVGIKNEGNKKDGGSTVSYENHFEPKRPTKQLNNAILVARNMSLNNKSSTMMDETDIEFDISKSIEHEKRKTRSVMKNFASPITDKVITTKNSSIRQTEELLTFVSFTAGNEGSNTDLYTSANNHLHQSKISTNSKNYLISNIANKVQEDIPYIITITKTNIASLERQTKGLKHEQLIGKSSRKPSQLTFQSSLLETKQGYPMTIQKSTLFMEGNNIFSKDSKEHKTKAIQSTSIKNKDYKYLKSINNKSGLKIYYTTTKIHGLTNEYSTLTLRINTILKINTIKAKTHLNISADKMRLETSVIPKEDIDGNQHNYKKKSNEVNISLEQLDINTTFSTIKSNAADKNTGAMKKSIKQTEKEEITTHNFSYSNEEKLKKKEKLLDDDVDHAYETTKYPIYSDRETVLIIIPKTVNSIKFSKNTFVGEDEVPTKDSHGSTTFADTTLYTNQDSTLSMPKLSKIPLSSTTMNNFAKVLNINITKMVTVKRNLSIHLSSTIKQRNTNLKTLPIVMNSENDISYINNKKSIHQTSRPTNTGSITNLPMYSSKKEKLLELTTIKTQTSIDYVHLNISMKTLKQKTKSIKESTGIISEVRGSNTKFEMAMINKFDPSISKSRRNLSITLRGAFKLIIVSRMNYFEYMI